MINLNNINVYFGQGTPLETHALKNLNLTIQEGEFVTVIGSNGAGKSSLLNVLSGETTLSSGSITIDGTQVANLDTAERAHLIARVFQDPLAGSCEYLSIQ